MALSVIGAGMGRTGTKSLKLALEQLGFGPCFHMAEFFTSENGEALKAMWERVAFDPDPPDWDEVFAGYRSTVDFPASLFWRQLAEHYPDARVILSVRDAERWYASTQETIFKPDPERPFAERTDTRAGTVYKLVNQNTFGGDTAGRDHCIAVYEKHNAAVKATIPPERLLIYQPGEGWERLCAFLGVPVPDAPFPRENSTEAFEAARKAEAARAADTL